MTVQYLKTICLYVPALLVLILSLPLASFGQSGGLPNPEHITSEQGLPQAFIASILQDRQGFIWMATLDGLCRYDGRNFKVFQPGSGQKPSLSSTAVINLKEDAAGGIWITAEDGSVDYFNPLDETIENISENPNYKNALPWRPYAILPDTRKTLWISFKGQGLAAYDLTTQQTTYYRHLPEDPHSLSHDEVRGILEDRKGNLWMATGNGLDRLDRATGHFLHLRHQPGVLNSLPENNIFGIHERPDGTLLVTSANYVTLFNPVTGEMKSFRYPETGEIFTETTFATDLQGNDYIVQYGKMFRFHPESGLQLLLSDKETYGIKGIYVDRSNVLWVGTVGEGVLKFNLMAYPFTAMAYEKDFHTDLIHRILGIPVQQMPPISAATSPYFFRATLDHRNRVWFNTGATPFYRWDPASRQLDAIPFLINFQNQEPLPPASLATDPEGRVWALYDTLAAWYDEPAGQWVKFPYSLDLSGLISDRAGYMRLLQFVVDADNLWIITNSQGLFQVSRKTGAVRRHLPTPDDPSSISSLALFCVFSDPDDSNLLWVGTYGSGLCLFDKRTGKSRWFTIENGLPNNVIYAAIPSSNGLLWIATNQGLCKMDRSTFATKNYTRSDGLQANEFNRFHFLRLSDDQVVLGGLEGITAFYPDLVREDLFEPQVAVIDIQVNNQSLDPENELLEDFGAIQQVPHLNLSFDQNFITVGFAGLQYNNPGKMKFRYLLEGINEDWVVTSRPEAIYTNLSPGAYTMKLNVSNTSGVWSPHVRTLTFHISPPWWATWWAYGFYTLLIGGLLYGWRNLYARQKEAQHLRIIDEMKSRFFSNITHEFRTPLTLMLTPLDQIEKQLADPDAVGINNRRISGIRRNAHHLLQMVNQLLELSKLDAKVMKVENSCGDLRLFVEDLVHSFMPVAEEKEVAIVFNAGNIAGQYEFDKEKLKLVVYNLVANALKFTDSGGQIQVRLTALSGGVQLTVQDNGIGIPAEQQHTVFDRFYQIHSAAHNGTGIGLSLVKELVVLQQGTITVASEINRGSIFMVFLPLVPVGDERHDPAIALPAPVNNPVVKEPEGVPDDFPTVLLVEDNLELAEMIIDILKDTCHVQHAFNGKEGRARVLELMPDIVISDVLMPVMDGMTLCHQLKTDLATSHIPVILLTAKSSQISRMEGLEKGADQYLTKPFHADELILTVYNLNEQRKQYRKWLQGRIQEFHSDKETTVVSDPFLEQFYQTLEQQLDNPAFGVEELANELGIHRATMLRKVKALTNQSIIELIRQYRMKRASQLLSQGISVTETAYRVGFNNLPYFSKCFREVYHKTPSDYITEGKF